jgi:hypothetical protein
LAPLAGAPKGPPPFPIEPSEPPPKLPAKSAKKADPTLVEPVVKKPRPLSSDERDDLPPAKPVTWKTFLLIASLLVVVPALAIAGSRLLAARDDTSSFESTLEAANEAMERRDWDAPEGKNVKTLTDKLLAESPRRSSRAQPAGHGGRAHRQRRADEEIRRRHGRGPAPLQARARALARSRVRPLSHP